MYPAIWSGWAGPGSAASRGAGVCAPRAPHALGAARAGGPRLTLALAHVTLACVAHAAGVSSDVHAQVSRERVRAGRGFEGGAAPLPGAPMPPRRCSESPSEPSGSSPEGEGVDGSRERFMVRSLGGLRPGSLV